jgi:hypothetical protein
MAIILNGAVVSPLKTAVICPHYEANVNVEQPPDSGTPPHQKGN